MFNIFDMMRGAPGGAGLDAIARQFGLPHEQAQRAFAALMPAFALGLQRNAADPAGFANLMKLMAPAQGAGMWDAFSPQAKDQGAKALGQVFGPPELTRQVAEQAAHWSGVSAQVVQQMMPLVAAALVGSLSQFSDAMRAQAAQAGAPAASARPNDAAGQAYAAWAAMMRSIMGAGSPQPAPEPPKPQPEPGAGLNPWADMVRAMTGQAAVPAEPPKPPKPPEARSAPPERDPAPAAAGEDLGAAWSDAVQRGREAQEQYLATLQGIFDKFVGAAPDRR